MSKKLRSRWESDPHLNTIVASVAGGTVDYEIKSIRHF